MIGEQIGNFRIVARLGAGGMGEVFLAVHDAIGTKVAIKMLQPHISAGKDHVQRFFNEAIAAAKIQHAGIGKIFDVGFAATGRAYLVMEFLDGETLARRIQRLGRLPLAQIGDIGKQIASVLDAVHKAGITHRDLKPDNIFIVPDDELASGERVKVLDFGIAKLSGSSVGLTSTASGSMGTPAYMSPEQWKSSKSVDWRADAYSLGCLAFEMAAGRPPFVVETIGEACSKHLTEEPPPLGLFVATPLALETLVASLLAKNPDHRPRSMREIGHAFGALIGLPALPTGSSPPIPMMGPQTLTTLGGSATSVHARPPAKSRRLVVGLVAAGVALAGLVTVLAVVLARPADPDSTPQRASERVTLNVTPAPPVDAMVDPPAPDASVVAETPPAKPALVDKPVAKPVPIDKPRPVAPLGDTEVHALAARYAGAFGSCMDLTPGRKTVQIKLAVAPSGAVTTVLLSGGHQGTATGACVTRIVRGWRFRASTGGLFNFDVSGGEAIYRPPPPRPPVFRPPPSDDLRDPFP